MPPDHLLYPLDMFGQDFVSCFRIGDEEWKRSSVAFVGLARNCAAPLAGNLARLVELCREVGSWRLHVETNDNTDATDQVLVDFCRDFRRATFTSQRLDREQFSTEFAGRRTEALAEYRTACQRWVAENAADSDYVVALDFDLWGGWSHAGFIHGVGSLVRQPGSFGMASVSLLEWRDPFTQQAMWVQYDAWALRLNSTWDDYTANQGGWKHQWLPPVGSPPVPVVSAFGGMAIYRTADYLVGTYDGSDCEHVGFHDSIARKTGRVLCIDPAMRTVVQWLA